MVSNLRRLASDHADLHNSELPPNYLFPAANAVSLISDDFTQLIVLLTGPCGTPYSQGLWRLQLKIPEDYPTSPPRAFFKTRIWHPNVEESTGAVCVDTLKRDWDPKLMLRDVLVTISCLLIHPNPDSALNSAAGALLQDDYDEFARHAKLMTSIHAPIPEDIRDEVIAAKRRGEDPDIIICDEEIEAPLSFNAPEKVTLSGTTPCVVMKMTGKGPAPCNPTSQDAGGNQELYSDVSDDEANGDPAIASKENDPSLLPSRMMQAPVAPPTSATPRRNTILGKRPLSVLEMPTTDELPPCAEQDSGNSRKSPRFSLSLSQSSIGTGISIISSSSSSNGNRLIRQQQRQQRPSQKSQVIHNRKGTSFSLPFLSRPTITPPDSLSLETPSSISNDPSRKTTILTDAVPTSASISTTSTTSTVAMSAKAPPKIIYSKSLSQPRQAITSSTSISTSTPLISINRKATTTTGGKPRIGLRRL